jgi:putative selenate reductase
MLDEQSAASCGFVQRQQILHIDRLCNECGNCAIFCPSGGKPYTDKLTLFCSEEDMADSKNTGWLPLEDGSTKYSGVMDSQTAARTASIAAVVASRYPYLIALN